jgi:hypothetical protein
MANCRPDLAAAEQLGATLGLRARIMPRSSCSFRPRPVTPTNRRGVGRPHRRQHGSRSRCNGRNGRAQRRVACPGVSNASDRRDIACAAGRPRGSSRSRMRPPTKQRKRKRIPEHTPRDLVGPYERGLASWLRELEGGTTDRFEQHPLQLPSCFAMAKADDRRGTVTKPPQSLPATGFCAVG